MRVAVAGAGWAGLSAAVELASAGVSVDVFEAARVAGGRARRVTLDGVDLDNGQHILLGAYRETLRVIRLAGANPDALFLRMPLELVFPGEFALKTPRLPAPLHLLAGLVSAHGLTIPDKLGAIKFMISQRLGGFRQDLDTSVAALLRTHHQPSRVVRFLWEPLCIAALNTAMEEASARVFLTVLRDAFTQARADSDLLIPRVDLGAAFPDVAMAHVAGHGGRIRPGCAVTAIARDGVGFAVAGGSVSEYFDAIVCAVPPYRAAPLLAHMHPDLSAALGRFVYEPVVTCYLQYPVSVILPRPMIGMSASIGQWAFDRGQLGGPAGLIAVVVSAAARLREIDSHTLTDAIHRELAAIVRDLPDPIWQRVITERRATFRCLPGIARPATVAAPGLYLAGDHVENGYPATLEGAVRSGVSAARAVLRGR